jgi:hypothetical protein
MIGQGDSKVIKKIAPLPPKYQLPYLRSIMASLDRTSSVVAGLPEKATIVELIMSLEKPWMIGLARLKTGLTRGVYWEYAYRLTSYQVVRPRHPSLDSHRRLPSELTVQHAAPPTYSLSDAVRCQGGKTVNCEVEAGKLKQTCHAELFQQNSESQQGTEPESRLASVR